MAPNAVANPIWTMRFVVLLEYDDDNDNKLVVVSLVVAPPQSLSYSCKHIQQTKTINITRLVSYEQLDGARRK